MAKIKKNIIFNSTWLEKGVKKKDCQFLKGLKLKRSLPIIKSYFAEKDNPGKILPDLGNGQISYYVKVFHKARPKKSIFEDDFEDRLVRGSISGGAIGERVSAPLNSSCYRRHC